MLLFLDRSTTKFDLIITGFTQPDEADPDAPEPIRERRASFTA